MRFRTGFFRRAGWGQAVLIAALLAAGCEVAGSTPFPTITPDATMRAIPRMLTQTAAAPTITATPRRSPTPAPTATVTPTATPYPGSAERPGAAGERMALGAEGATFTVLAVTAPQTIPDQRAVEGQTFLQVELLIENNGSQPADYNRLDFRLAAGARGQEMIEPLPQAAGPLLLSGTLRPGEWVRGSAAFRIAAEASGLRLVWRPHAGGREAWVRVEPGMAAGAGLVPATGSSNGSGDLPSPGQVVSASGIRLSIDQTQVGGSAFRRRARTGYRFAVLSVTITNEARDRAPFNASYFRAKDEAGFEYAPVALPSEELIGAGSLSRGQRVSGQVVFEIPEETRELVIKYHPQVLVEPYEEIRVRALFEQE